MTTDKTLLIDGDIFLYRAALGTETHCSWEDGEYTIDQNPEHAEAVFDGIITSFTERFKAHPIICLTDTSNWRKKLEPSYKSNRKDQRKPPMLPALKAYSEANYDCDKRPGLEADDVIGILMTSDKTIKGRKCVVTIDKDLLQIPGKHWNPDKQKMVVVEPEAGHRLHMLQSIAGDPVDGYKGVPGIGMKRAAKILDGRGEDVGEWEAIVAAYDKAGLDADHALTQARLAHILDADHYDDSKEEPILWMPTTTT